MEATEANNIPLEYILSEYNRYPVKSYNLYDMYCSPFRNEKNASFKVDKVHNRWNDFGSGEYGSAVDLVMKLENCSFLEAMGIFETKKFNQGLTFEDLERRQSEFEKPHSELSILKIAPLNNKILLNYIKSRGIDEDIAQRLCKEMYYKIGENGRNCFAIAFENNSGGVEFRNPMFKGCAKHKDLTVYENGNSKCAVFEGFIDMLTYFQITKNDPQKQAVDVVVLNSTTMLDRSLEFLKKHASVHAFLDNDQAGRSALNRLISAGINVVNEAAYIYPKHKDFNEFWMEQIKLNQSPDKKKEMRENPVKRDHNNNHYKSKSIKF
ncbi:toprim domain-containing protein [Massilibacteroides vaginae]|uniref:toprim domain-containing protein n=1 Tax=Massilibacteroides vaginae TaxID=1673718 RepID=UPI000A1CB6D3|nr:toprim domain-containing protein [Massilibacteroides vaginae]